MTKFTIGFMKKSYAVKLEKYEQYYKVSPRIEKLGDDRYLQISGSFYDLFKLYNDNRPSDTMISSFDIPEDIPIWFNNEDLKNLYKVKLIEVSREEPGDLAAYLTTKGRKSDTKDIRAKNYAIVKGKVRDVFNVMSNIRDDMSESPFETQKHYEQICKMYNLPALTLFVTHN